jgi:hypothetical protein
MAECCYCALEALRARHCHESRPGRHMSRDIGDTCVTRSLETPAIGVTLVCGKPSGRTAGPFSGAPGGSADRQRRRYRPGVSFARAIRRPLGESSGRQPGS